MNAKLNIGILILTVLFGGILILADVNPTIALIGGGLTWFMFYFLWSPPPKHKDFSDRDRLEAMARGAGSDQAN